MWFGTIILFRISILPNNFTRFDGCENLKELWRRIEIAIFFFWVLNISNANAKPCTWHHIIWVPNTLMFFHMFSQFYLFIFSSHFSSILCLTFSYFLHQVLVFIILAFLRVLFFNFIFEKTYSPLYKRVSRLWRIILFQKPEGLWSFNYWNNWSEIKIASKFKILTDIFFIVTYIINFLFSGYFSYIFQDFWCKTKISNFLKLFYF